MSESQFGRAAGRHGASRRDLSATLTVSLDSGARSAGAALALDSVWMERFLVRSVLGSGASAAVFEALDLQTQREVALKVLRSRRPSAVARLKAEFRTLAQIAHPNLVAMHALWVDEQSRGVISMDVVRGRNFLDYVRPEPLGRRDDARLRSTLEQLVRGVQYLHAHGCLHRDLKPSNVLVSEAGQLTIVDFGLAQSTRDTTELQDSTFEGTPAYAAPEQLDAERITAASDWYAVGGMLYEALCGQRPFSGKTTELLARKSAYDPPAPSLRTREIVPPELERVCMQLLVRDPAQRAQGDDVLASLGADSHVPEVWHPDLTSTLAGRELEQSTLARWFERVAYADSGRGVALAILGDSGVGKTTLSNAFLDGLRTHGRARVLSGRCFVHEALAYNAFDEILETLSHWLRQLSDAARAALLPVDFAPLSLLFPALRNAAPSDNLTEASPARAGLGERARAFRALRQLFERVSREQPLVLHVDDLQWADADSLALLHELLSDPVPRLCLLVTVRHDAADAEPMAALLEHCEQLALGPLSERAVRALASEQIVGCTEALADAIARESAGHPLLAKELIAHARRSDAAVTPGVAGLAVALRERLSMLSPRARVALEMLCVAGQPLPRSCVLDLGASVGVDFAALRELRVACALRETLREGVILVEPYHDSIRQLLASDIEAQRAQALHLQLAQELCRLGERYLELAVHHYVSGGEWRLAAHLAERAADRAGAGLALNRAAALLELALRSVAAGDERDRLQLAAADACARAGRNLAAAQHYEQAADRATGPRRLELQLQALTAYHVSGHSTRGRAVLETLAREAQLSLELRSIGVARGAIELMVMMLTGLPYLRRPDGWPLRAHSTERDTAALRVLWSAAATLVPIDGMASCQFAARALALAARTGDRAVYGQALALHVALVPATLNYRPRLVKQRLERARRLAQTSCDFWDDAYVRVAQGSSALLASEYVAALDAALEIAQIPQLRTPISAHVRTSARIVSLLSLYWLGRITQLSELSHAWLEDGIDCGDRMQESAFRTMSCYGHLRRDRVDKALQEIERTSALRFDFISDFGADPWWFAGVAQYRGDAVTAAKMCRDSHVLYGVYARYCASARAEWNLALGGTAAALAAQNVERVENVRMLQREARQVAWCWGRIARPFAAQLGATHAALSGKPDRAVSQLRRAAQAYDGLGMQLHAASVRFMLARLPARDAAAQESAALKVFRAQGIARPELWARMLVPGFQTTLEP